MARIGIENRKKKRKNKNSSKFRVSTGQNFFRWARFARQTVHRGNTTRISLLGKHVGRNGLLNTLIETETWAPMKGVCFKTCHLQYRHWPSIRYWLDVQQRDRIGSFPRDHPPSFLLSRLDIETNTMGCKIVVFLSNSISLLFDRYREPILLVVVVVVCFRF